MMNFITILEKKTLFDKWLKQWNFRIFTSRPLLLFFVFFIDEIVRKGASLVPLFQNANRINLNPICKARVNNEFAVSQINFVQFA